MRNVTLFIAMSLDGYIAKKDGSVDWLQGQETEQDDMVSYQEFIQDVDTVIMGWNTYHQIITELSPERWLYEHLDSYIFTHRKLIGKENIHFIQGDICESILHMKRQEGKDIWICGGADIIQPLIEQNIIDTYHISVIPIILGSGIPLFQGRKTILKLKLAACKVAGRHCGIGCLQNEERFFFYNAFYGHLCISNQDNSDSTTFYIITLLYIDKILIMYMSTCHGVTADAKKIIAPIVIAL